MFSIILSILGLKSAILDLITFKSKFLLFSFSKTFNTSQVLLFDKRLSKLFFIFLYAIFLFWKLIGNLNCASKIMSSFLLNFPFWRLANTFIILILSLSGKVKISPSFIPVPLPKPLIVAMFLICSGRFWKLFHPILPLNFEELLIEICLAISRKLAPSLRAKLIFFNSILLLFLLITISAKSYKSSLFLYSFDSSVCSIFFSILENCILYLSLKTIPHINWAMCFSNNADFEIECFFKNWSNFSFEFSNSAKSIWFAWFDTIEVKFLFIFFPADKMTFSFIKVWRDWL